MQKTILIGKRYEAEKESHGASERFLTSISPSHQNDDLEKTNIRTAKKIADELGIGQATVERAGKLVRAIGIADSIAPGIEKEIITSTIKPTKHNIIAITRASPEELPQMVEELRKPKPKPSKPSPPSEDEPEPISTFSHIDANIDSSTVAEVTEEDILKTMEGAADVFISTCENHFQYFPKLLTEHKYLRKVQMIMSKPYNHIKSKIKESNE